MKAGKIVAGLEVENTNFLLQAIGKAIESKVDSSEYVKKINSRNEVKSHNTKSIKKTSDAKKSNKTTKNKQIIPQPKTKNTPSETPKSKRSTPKDSPKEGSKTKSDKDPNEKEKTIKQNENKKTDTKIRLSPVLNNTVDDEKKESLESYKELQSNQNDEPQHEEDVKSDILPKNTNIILNNENVEVLRDNNSQKEENNNVQDDSQKEEDKCLKKDSNIHKNSAMRPKSARPKSGEGIKNETDDIKPLEMKGMKAAYDILKSLIEHSSQKIFNNQTWFFNVQKFLVFPYITILKAFVWFSKAIVTNQSVEFKHMYFRGRTLLWKI